MKPLKAWAILAENGDLAHGWDDIESKHGGLKLHALIYRTKRDAQCEARGGVVVRVEIREVAK